MAFRVPQPKTKKFSKNEVDRLADFQGFGDDPTNKYRHNIYAAIVSSSMNIAEVIIDFENEDANDLPVPSCAQAAGQMELLTWNPQKKEDVDLFDDGEFGVHCVLDQSGFGLKVSVYQIWERPKRPDYVDVRTDHADGSYEISSRPAYKFDPKYFIKDSSLIAQADINLRTLFGKGWRDYLSLISDMKGGSVRQIERSEVMRGSAHNALAEKLAQKLESMGFDASADRYSPLRQFISMLVEYHYQYGNVSAHYKIGIEPPKSEPS